MKRMCRFNHVSRSPRKRISSKMGTSKQPRRIAITHADELWPCRRLASVAIAINCASRCTKAPKKQAEKCIRKRTGGNQGDGCTDCEHEILEAGKAQRNGRATRRPKRVAKDGHKR